jgi:putative hydroxymethylpyrimidine transport system permease protein
MTRLLAPLVTTAGLLALWQAVVLATAVPAYILPPPLAVLNVLVTRYDLLFHHALVTGAEIVLGFVIGATLGIVSALCLMSSRMARQWLLPVLVTSQALPVFALAPLLVLWLGYGMASKVGMAVLIIFFPVAAAFFDGLRRTEPGWIELARSMNAGWGAVLFQIRLPAALPALGSGLRVAASVAPIGAVVGEWVGSSAGLGHLMLHANARMQIDLMFAALFTLAVMALALYFAVDRGARRLVPWQSERLDHD